MPASTTTKPITLADFIETEMKDRNMGVREFARFVGVSHSTLSKHLTRKRNRPVPREDLLVKLSDATGVNLLTLFALAYPGVAARTALSPRAMLLAQRFEKLPEAVQDFIFRAALSQQE